MSDEIRDITEILDDLYDQAELYDMDVDVEALTLVPKKVEPKLSYWEYINSIDGDREPVDYQGWE